jgi:lipopolysaccharide export LptBFGC system permease protein LptF
MARLVLLTVALVAAVSNAFVVPALQQQSAKLVAQSRAVAPVRMRYVHALLLLLLFAPC